MNNKGQSLVLFVLVLPIILFILILVYEFGSMVLLKLELDNINKLALDYGLDNIDNNNIISEINELILKNKEDLNLVEIDLDNGKIYITLRDSIDGDIGLFKDNGIFNMESSYVGYLNSDKKIIERNK